MAVLYSQVRTFPAIASASLPLLVCVCVCVLVCVFMVQLAWMHVCGGVLALSALLSPLLWEVLVARSSSSSTLLRVLKLSQSPLNSLVGSACLHSTACSKRLLDHHQKLRGSSYIRRPCPVPRPLRRLPRRGIHCNADASPKPSLLTPKPLPHRSYKILLRLSSE